MVFNRSIYFQKKETERRSNLDSACVSGLLTFDPAAARRKREEQRLAILDEAKAKQLKREKEVTKSLSVYILLF